MPKRREYWFGQIKSVTKRDGSAYPESDLRMRYPGRDGLIVLYDSVKLRPGQSFFWFFPCEEGRRQPYFHSSCGYWEPDGEKDTLVTENSRYILARGDVSLSEARKKELLLNAGIRLPDSVLIDSGGIQPERISFGLPWDSDAKCFNFMFPKASVRPDKLYKIRENADSVKALVIGCPLESYSFIKDLHELRQLYIYDGSSVSELSFVEGLVKLQQLYIDTSHVEDLAPAARLLEKKKTICDSIPKGQQLATWLFYTMDGFFIRSDRELKGAEELKSYRRYIGEIIINDKWLCGPHVGKE